MNDSLGTFWRDSETPTVISRPVVTRTPPPPEPEPDTGLATRLPWGHRPPNESCSCCHPDCGIRLVRRFFPRPRAVLMHPNVGRIHLYLPLAAVRYLTLITYQQGRYLFPHALVSPAGKPHVHPVPLPPRGPAVATAAGQVGIRLIENTNPVILSLPSDYLNNWYKATTRSVSRSAAWPLFLRSQPRRPVGPARWSCGSTLSHQPPATPRRLPLASHPAAPIGTGRRSRPAVARDRGAATMPVVC